MIRTSATLVLLLTAGCSDLSTSAAREPASLEIDRDTVLTTVGDEVSLGVRVLDRSGRAFDHVPAFAAPSWSSSNRGVVRVEGSTLRAAGPGQARATVRLAELTGSSVVRVNPRELQLTVDSVHVSQGSAARGSTLLVPGEDADLRIFLSGDQPNFFRPAVRIMVLRDMDTVYVNDVRHHGESVPLSGTGRPPSSTWNARIPGSAVSRGNSLVVEADPERIVPRAAGSVDRHPAAGSRALTFDLKLRIEGVHLTQSVQSLEGGVPLIAGRDALLRVFMTGDVAASVRPAVRATLYRGGTAVHTMDIERTSEGVSQHLQPETLGLSWNAVVPGSVIGPGLSIVVQADPDGELSLHAESVTRLPDSGSAALDVRPVPKLWSRIVPVHQTATGTTGRVSETNMDQFTRPLLAKFPIAEFDFDLRVAYSTDARLDTQSGWTQLLREIDALRSTDGSARYYYGVHTNPPGAMWGGLGFVGWPASIGYDDPRYGPETMAHELGHNFNLLHAPCGNPAGIDADFPYGDGGTGQLGYDLFTGRLKSPGTHKDLMTYCRPEWISDYSYLKVLGFRDEWDWTSTGPDASGAPEPSILLWGGVEGGRLVLEPAFELEMRPRIPSRTGPYRLQGYAADGTLLFGYSFQANPVDHRPGDRSFSFAVPSRLARADRLARLRLTGPEGAVEIGGAADRVEREPRVTQRGEAAGVRIDWPADTHPVALVRDAASGDVLTFARRGTARVRARGRPLEVLLSDGVRTTRHTLRPF